MNIRRRLAVILASLTVLGAACSADWDAMASQYGPIHSQFSKDVRWTEK